ncbi:MAG: DUF1206 domain-containing protein [Hasllibacter sp.]
MRAGYAGRALTYAAVAGLSLWAISRGGEARDTTSALEALQGAWWGTAVIAAAAAGLLAYMVWRLIDAALDLERYGSEAKGLVARGGMVVTGLVHGALGVAVAGVLGVGPGDGGSGGVAGMVGTVMGWPGGRWIVGIGGLLTVAAGVYYLRKAWTRSYREHLLGNPATRRWDGLLALGVAAQGVVVLLAGGLLIWAALQGDPDEAGGLGRVFEWLSTQPFGRVLVAALCAGLLLFAAFCAVNARYRIVPGLHDPDAMPGSLRSALS